MFKLRSLTIGFLTLITIAPSSQAATFQTRLKLHQIDGELSAQKLVPLKKSSSLRTTVIFKTPIAAPSNKKVDSSDNRENQRIKTACQREIEARQPFGAISERPLSVGENPKNSNSSSNFSSFSTFKSSTYSGNCNFTGKF
jgi:hypothetical protein